MDIVCIIDVVQSSNLAHRKRALEEVKQASMIVNANLFIVSVIPYLSFVTLTPFLESFLHNFTLTIILV